MTDIVDKVKRSEMMSGITGKNTSPERAIRSELHRRGYRFRLHDNSLPGKPDIVLPKYRVLIQVNGCFWHGHDCHLMKWPSTRPEFWRKKINANSKRDEKNKAVCKELGWRLLVIWECAIKGKKRITIADCGDEIEAWIRSEVLAGEIRGT